MESALEALIHPSIDPSGVQPPEGFTEGLPNAHKHIERDGGKTPHWELISAAATEVGPALFYSLLVITVSFVPVFTLEVQEGRLFKPLAFTKSYSMAAAALLSVTLVPFLMRYFIRGKILPEHRNPLNRFLVWLYHPILEFALRFKYLMLAVAVLMVAVTVIPFERPGFGVHAAALGRRSSLHGDHAPRRFDH